MVADTHTPVADCEPPDFREIHGPIQHHEDGTRTLYTTYRGDIRTVDGVPRSTFTLGQALEEAYKPGDTVQLLPGTYWPVVVEEPCNCEDGMVRSFSRKHDPFDMIEKHGLPEMPITIRGMGERTLLSGDTTTRLLPDLLPRYEDYSFFRLMNCEWIVFENFTVEGCWPTFSFIQNSQYVSYKSIMARDSRYLVYARGMGSHHILLEDNDWVQDPTRSMWTDLDWLDAKEETYCFYDGGIFGSLGIPGSVILRGNTLRDCFNGMRMKPGGDAPYSCQNLNVELYDNTFIRVRDNVTEPEKHAKNWYFSHNDVCNAHSWFSFDKVEGGWWFYTGNTGWFTSKPGQPHDPNSGGKVIKLKKVKKENAPVWFFNNSWYLRCFVIKKGYCWHLNLLNNAIQFCTPEQYPECVCLDDRAITPEDFSVKEKYAWRFNGDLCNKPWPEWIEKQGQEEQGEVQDFSFTDPQFGDLTLHDAPDGIPVTLRGGIDWPGEDWTLEAPLVGAWQRNGALVEGPPFRFYAPGDECNQIDPESELFAYKERPRVVRCHRYLSKKQNKLTVSLIFSVPVTFGGETTGSITIETPAGPVQTTATIAERTLVADPVDCDPAVAADAAIILPTSLADADGTPVTSWACPDKHVEVAL